jgi:hypothetical protein
VYKVSVVSQAVRTGIFLTGDGHHELGGIARLAVVVTAVTASITGAAVGVALDGLEVREDGVSLGLAGGVCVGGRNAVILGGVSSACGRLGSNETYLRNEVEHDHVSRLGGDGVRGELELIIRSDSDHHCCGGRSQTLGQSRVDDV